MFWSHVVYLLVYVALLGYGIAGAFGALLPEGRLTEPRVPLFGLLGFALSNLGAVKLVMVLAQARPNTFILGATDGGVLGLVVSYSLFAVPYFFLGLTLVSVFTRMRESFDRIYMIDLVGAALGCVLFVLLLEPLGAPRMLFALSAICTVVAWVGLNVVGLRSMGQWWNVICAATFALCGYGLIRPDMMGEMRPSPDKILGHSLNTTVNPDVRVEHTAWNPVGRLDIFRSASSARVFLGFGWSGTASFIMTYDGDAYTEFPVQTDEHWPTEEDRRVFAADKTAPRWMQATPYLWHPNAEVLVVGIGGGGDLRVAQLQSARAIDGVEINHSTIKALTGTEASGAGDRFARASGNIYGRPNTRIHAGDGRSFLMNTTKTWDIIHMTGIDTFLASSNGSFVTAESYLYTVEAMKSFYSHLKSDGIYTCVRWFYRGLPRESFRVFSIALRALQELGVENPPEHLAVTTFGNAQAILFMKHDPFRPEQLVKIAERAREGDQGLLFAPGLRPTLPEGTIFAALADAYQKHKEEAFFAGYPYDVSPVYDDCPYFYQYYKLSRLFEAWIGKQALEGAPQHGYWPYVVLGAVLVQALILVGAFIFVPLLVWRRSGLRVPRATSLVAYFASLGMGYIMIELVFMQKLALLLGDPIHSIVIVLGSMLVFTGAGSFLSGRWPVAPPVSMKRALAVLLGLLLLVLLAGDWIVHSALGQPFWLRVLLAIALCGSVSLALGHFFPLGVRVVTKNSPAFLPWAWGINGGFSVLGSIMTIILGMSIGFTAALATAAFVYAGGVLKLAQAAEAD
jgi:spermidine synthase